MQKVMREEKLVFDQVQVKVLDVPKWPELAVSRIWPEALKMPGFQQYVPDEWLRRGYPVPRDFFYGILGTVATEYTVFLIQDCRAQRVDLKEERAAVKEQ